MKIIPLEFEGIVQIKPEVYGDTRGFFLEFWNEAKYNSAGLKWKFVQDNISRSSKGVLRGLHFQNPKPQAKLISVLEGEVFDVIVDLRRSSRTFKKWTSFNLSAASLDQIYIPSGFAHGFQVTSDSALFAYKCTEFYDASVDTTLRWDDPELQIRWPISTPSVSAKDSQGKFLSTLEASKFFD